MSFDDEMITNRDLRDLFSWRRISNETFMCDRSVIFNLQSYLIFAHLFMDIIEIINLINIMNPVTNVLRRVPRRKISSTGFST